MGRENSRFDSIDVYHTRNSDQVLVHTKTVYTVSSNALIKNQ